MCGSLVLLILVVKYIYAVLLQINFCQNLRTFLGKMILDQTLLV